MRLLIFLTCALTACDSDDDAPTGDAGAPDALLVDSAAPDAAPDDAAPDDAALPDALAPDGAAPLDDAAPDGAVPPDAAPDDAAMDDAAQRDAMVVDGAIDPDGAVVDPDGAVEPDVGVVDPECEAPGDCLDFRACVAGQCVEPEVSEFAAAVVLNEVLVDGAIDIDANGDGDISAVEDAFVEWVNVGAEALAMEGWLLVERDLQGLPRHTFGAGAELAPGEALVVFGGGAVSEELEATPGATFVVANAQDPAFPNGLGLNAGGDRLRLLDADGDEVAVFEYGCDGCPEIAADRSLTRVPDLVGDFEGHPEGPASPGTLADGTPFAP